MNASTFDSLYGNTRFFNYIRGMLRKLYHTYRDTLQNNGIDYDDLEQECWAALYESAEDGLDNGYYVKVIKHAAIDFLRTFKAEIRCFEYTDDDVELLEDE